MQKKMPEAWALTQQAYSALLLAKVSDPDCRAKLLPASCWHGLCRCLLSKEAHCVQRPRYFLVLLVCATVVLNVEALEKAALAYQKLVPPSSNPRKSELSEAP
jgi:hypothetical protein